LCNILVREKTLLKLNVKKNATNLIFSAQEKD